MHHGKRKRVDATASSAVNKPFRSPLHVDPNRQKPASPVLQDVQTVEKFNVNTPDTQSHLSHTRTAPPLPLTRTLSPPQVAGHRPHSASHSPDKKTPLSRSSSHDSKYIVLQKQHSALALHLKDLRSSLDTANQALKIIRSSKDAEVRSSTTKWQTASREAAEDLFSAAKDRVDHMGGMDTWRKQYAITTAQRQAYWDDESESDPSDLTKEQKEELEFTREEMRIEAEKYGLNPTKSQTTVEDTDDHDHDNNDSFTMDMMLKQLNIDLDTIGYDIKAQCWKD